MGEKYLWFDPYGTHRFPNSFPHDEGLSGKDHKNDAKVAAIEVDFGLVTRASPVATAKVIGTFSPGDKIEHEFVNSREVFPIGSRRCYRFGWPVLASSSRRFGFI